AARVMHGHTRNETLDGECRTGGPCLFKRVGEDVRFLGCRRFAAVAWEQDAEDVTRDDVPLTDAGENIVDVFAAELADSRRDSLVSVIVAFLLEGLLQHGAA